jgi:hypothetical protein
MRPLVPPAPIARSGLAMLAQNRTERRFILQSNRAQNRRSVRLISRFGGPTNGKRIDTCGRGRVASTNLNYRINPSEASVTPINARPDLGTPAPEPAIDAGATRDAGL